MAVLVLLAGSFLRTPFRSLCRLLLAAAVGACILAAGMLRHEAQLCEQFAEKSVSCELEMLQQSGELYTAKVLRAGGKRVHGLRVSFWMEERLFAGERLQAEVQFQSADTAQRRGVYLLRAKLGEFSFLQKRNGLRFGVARLKAAFSAALSALMRGEAGAMCISVVTGDTSVLPQSLKTDIRRAGLSDMLAVSGMHVGLVLSMVQFRGRKRNALSFALSAVLGVLLCVFYNGSASVVRAAVMQLTALLGRCIGRRSDALTSLGFSVLLLCAANPYVVFDLGFLMSVSCCLGIFLLAQPLQNGGSGSRVLQSVAAQQLLLSLCVGLSLLPCYLAAGLSVSLTAPFATALTGFVMLPQLVCAVLAGVFQLLLPFCFAAKVCALGAAVCSKWILLVARSFSQLPFASVALGGRWVKGAVCVCILLLLPTLFGRIKVRHAVALCTAVMLLGVSVQTRYSAQKTAVYAFDSGAAVVHGGFSALFVCAPEAESAYYLWQDVADHCLPMPSYVIIETVEDGAAAKQYFPAAAVVQRTAPAGVLLLADARVQADTQCLLLEDVCHELSQLMRCEEDTVFYLLPDGSWKAEKL